jgi:hypothetical protein
MAPVVEDLVLAQAQLKCVQGEVSRTSDEAHELVVRSRRQRLGLRLLQRTDAA